MIQHLGFSYIGLIFIVMLVIPNLIWIKNKPLDYTNNDNENRILLFFEKIGQISLVTLTLLTKEINVQEINTWTVWLYISFIFMVIYELWWLKYFKNDKTLSNFYSNFWGIPIPGATIPVIAFFSLSIYCKSIPLFIATIIFGIGHIGIHLAHKSSLKNKK